MSSDLAAAIDRTARLTGAFVLRSGETATEYFDKYQFEGRPDMLARIARAMAPLVPVGTNVVAGLELGGVPVATALSLYTGVPAAFVRKRAKQYGTRRLAEGTEIDGMEVLVIEDVVNSGGQIALSANDLRERGARVTAALCVVDRQAGATEALAEVGIRLRSLFTRADLESTRR